MTTHKEHGESSTHHSKHGHTDHEIQSSSTSIVGEDRAALRHHGLYKPKTWLTHTLTGFMQLPNSTPLYALRWTTPEGPMPHILHLPSREEGRSVRIYVWIPPNVSSGELHHSKSHSHHHVHDSDPNSIRPSFDCKRRPCVVDFHGGSFIMGGPLEQAPWCSSLARSGIIAISVQYRLGPHWEFPAALLDAEDVIEALLDQSNSTESGKYIRNQLNILSDGQIEIDETKIGLSGFSSGGNIALNMLLSIPAHLNTSKAGGVLDPEPSLQDDEGNDDEEENGGDWPSPFIQTQSPIHSIPTLLFFPSLDVRQAEFERNRPEGLAEPGEVGKWVGRRLENAYLPKQFTSHLRASPGLAPIGIPGGLKDEIAVRKEAAKEQGLPLKNKEEELSINKKQSTALKYSTLDCLHPATKAILILPEIDNLSEQSEVWVKALESAEKVTISPEKDGSEIGKVFQSKSSKQSAMGHVRVHRIEKMTHGFTTYPDSFLDERTKEVKHLVMEQARQFMINMFLKDVK